MKKSLIVLAALASIAGSAAAQSSVTLFGLVDMATRYTKANGISLKKLSDDGSSSSRFGVRGVEDLGDGLKASFWLESQLIGDTGVVAAAGFWNRRSTVSLAGNFGEVRLGRDKTAVYLQLDDFDPYGDVGLATMTTTYSALGSTAGGSFGSSTMNRNNNQVIYILPSNLGGLYGQVNVAAGEAAGTATAFGQKQYSGRLGYKDARLNVSGAYGETTIDPTGVKFKVGSLAAAYDFGVAKPTLVVTQNKYLTLEQKAYTLGVTVPVGPTGSFLASFTSDTVNDAAVAAGFGKATQASAGYLYGLSKRTFLYSTVTQVSNKGKAKYAVTDSPTVLAGQKSSGIDVGLKHSF